MVIQYKVSKIVMLTKTEEQNPHKPTETLVIIFILKINFYNFFIKNFSQNVLIIFLKLKDKH
jgi:hypothetical protein